MAENQGNSSHHMNQAAGRNFFQRLDFLSNSDTQNDVSDRRQTLKINLGSGSSNNGSSSSSISSSSTTTTTNLSFTNNSTNSTYVVTNSTSMSSCHHHHHHQPLQSSRPSLPLPRPNLPIRPRPMVQQEFLPDKPSNTVETRYYSREKLRMCQSMQSTGKLQLSHDVIYDFTSEDLQDLGEIGRGGFGTVNKMIHRISNTVMAVKRIRSTVDEREQKQLLMDLEVVMKSNECPCIVQFYGALFKEGDCWICMELMDTSLDKFYKFIYERLNERIPENILGKITVATVKALNYLKEKLKIIHRDVKPSNILLDRRGNIKLCDFGISGQLVDSIARTRDAGCRPYMAPERIDPQRARGYDVRSDVWSLGITLMEVATGYFPYPKWNSVFEQLYQVVQGDPPRLSPNENGNRFTMDFVNFVNTCLIKEETQRPKYNKLLEHPFIRKGDEAKIDVAAYVSGVLDSMANNGITPFTTNQP